VLVRSARMKGIQVLCVHETDRGGSAADREQLRELMHGDD
jgi:valyl-tRNA synthetase